MKKYIYIISLLCAIFSSTDMKAQVHEIYPGSHKNRLYSPDDEITITKTESYFSEVDTSNRYSNTYGENTNDIYYGLTLTTTAELHIRSKEMSETNFTMIYLLDYRGEWIAVAGWNQESGIKEILSPGKYYIVVEKFRFDGLVSFSIESNVSQSSPISIGTKSSDFTYTNTQNSSLSHTFTNGYGGGAGTDIPYTFTITKPMDIQISHCGSALNYTNIFFTDGWWSKYLYCGNTKQRIFTVKDLPAGTYTFISEGDYNISKRTFENGSITTTITGTVSKTIDLGKIDSPVSFTDTKNSSNFDNDYIDYAGKEIRYKINTAKFDKVYFQISNCGSTISDTRIQLLDTRGETVASSTDYNNVASPCKGSKQAFIRTDKVMYGASYFILSEGRYNDGNITTNIQVSEYPFENDWGILKGLKIKRGIYNIGKCLNLYEAGAGNDIIHKFTLEEPLDVFVSHAGSKVDKSKIYLLDASRNLVASSESGIGDPNGNNTRHAFLKKELLPTGTYYIVSEAGAQNADLMVSLTVSPQEKPVIDIGSKSSAFTYTDTKGYQDYTNTYNNSVAVDIEYRLSLTEVMDLSISISSYGSLYLLDSQRGLIREGSNSLNINTLQAGVYYIINTSSSSNEGSSTIKVIGSLSTSSTEINPSSEVSYIQKRVYTSPKTYLTETQYYDGLGRPSQQVKNKITPNEGDLVVIQDYDEFGRPLSSWLPTPVYKNRGRYIEAAQVYGYVRNTYKDEKPYSLSEYELSPLKKVTKQYGPGVEWHDMNKKTSFSHKVNTLDEPKWNCCLYRVGGTNSNPSLSQNGNYETGELVVTEVRDENDNISYKFEDKLERVVLSRQIQGDVNHDTYYVYNDCGYLCYVLPPKINEEGIAQEALHKLAYQYKYNNLGQCIAKKLPGCDWIYYVYDYIGQLIFSQDGEQRQKGVWTFMLPDAFGRIVLTGTCTNSFDYTLIQPMDEIVCATWAKTTNIYKGYIVSGINLIDPTILSVNYYDSYDFMGLNSIPSTTDPDFRYTAESGYGDWYSGDYTDANRYKSKGLLTGSSTALLTADSITSSIYLYSIMYYDYKGQLIQTKSNNHLAGGIEKEYIAYNFTGHPIQKLQTSSNNKSLQTQEHYRYSYDRAFRLIKTEHRINELPWVTLSTIEYDELGRISRKKIGK